MKNIIRKNEIIVIAIAAITLLCPTFGFSEDAPLFHVVATADSVSDKDSYVNGAISAVTNALGAPSAAWFNPDDETLIDYIYIGNSLVLTFKVTKEGKTVSEVLSEARADWENGGCLAYPECPMKPAGGN